MAVSPIPCEVIGILENNAINQILALQQKVQSLTRQAAMLVRLAAELPFPAFPDIPTDFSISAITPDFLAQLQAACPALDLSALAGVGVGVSVADEVNVVRAAYQRALSQILDTIERHPLAAIASFQNQLDNQINKVLATVANVGGFASCVCNATNVAIDQASDFYNSLTTSRPTLITPEIQVQMAGFQNAQNNVKAALQLAA